MQAAAPSRAQHGELSVSGNANSTGSTNSQSKQQQGAKNSASGGGGYASKPQSIRSGGTSGNTTIPIGSS